MRLSSRVGVRRVWLGAAVATALACEVPPEPSASDGIGIDAPLLSFNDTVTLGGAAAEGPEAFGLVRSVALVADETEIAIADGQTQELHLFSVTGEHVRTFSGRGSGPGEHRAIREVWGARDGSLCTWDVQTPRVTRFNNSGEVISSSPVDLEGMESIRPSFQGFLDDCTFVLRDEPFIGDMKEVPEGLRQDTVRFHLFGADGSDIRVLAQPTGAERWFRDRDRIRGFVDVYFR